MRGALRSGGAASAEGEGERRNAASCLSCIPRGGARGSEAAKRLPPLSAATPLATKERQCPARVRSGAASERRQYAADHPGDGDGLRREDAQGAATGDASRPYSEQLRQIMSDLATQQPDPEQLAQFPLLQKRPVRVELIVVTPDRGLTGALNTNILRRGSRFIWKRRPVQVIAVGKKARDYFVRTRQDVIAEFIGIGDTTTLDAVRPIADIAIDDFASGQGRRGLRRLFPIYQHAVQRPEFMQILPSSRRQPTRGTPTTSSNRPSRRAQRAAAALRRGPALPGDPGGDRPEHSARMSPCAAPPTMPKKSSRS